MILENRAFTVSLKKNSSIKMNVIPGHFSTKHYHSTHYLDLCNLKNNATIASNIAAEMALPYMVNKLVDTIVCIEGTEVIGAYMARGVTVNNVLECLAYYGGKVMGISTLFNTLAESHDYGTKTLFKNIEVHSLFTDKDIPSCSYPLPLE